MLDFASTRLFPSDPQAIPNKVQALPYLCYYKIYTSIMGNTSFTSFLLKEFFAWGLLKAITAIPACTTIITQNTIFKLVFLSNAHVYFPKGEGVCKSWVSNWDQKP